MYYLYYLFWPIYFYNNYLNDIPIKINLNYLSFTHSITCSGLSYILINYINNTFFNKLLYYNSTSYFAFDIIQIIIRKKWNDLAYIYHHSVCLYILNDYNNNINKELILNLLYIGELSNIFNYIVYDFIHKKYNLFIIYIFKIIQLLWFTYYRIYYFSYFILIYYSIYKNTFICYILLSIYLMGYIWGYGQIKKLYYDTKIYML